MKPKDAEGMSWLGKFQLLLKGCTIEAVDGKTLQLKYDEFQLLLKGCTIEAKEKRYQITDQEFQLLLKGCTIEAPKPTD